jgi:hypothetical protein
LLINNITINTYKYYDVIKGHMVAIETNFNTFNNVAGFMNIFSGFDNDFEITLEGVFRKINPPPCPICVTKMNQNGYNEIDISTI